MSVFSLIGLMQIDLPTRTVRLCDGGFVVFGGQTFTSHDPLVGSLTAVEGLAEGVGDEIPGMQLSFLPAGDAAVAELVDAAWQTARIRFWVGDYSPATGLLIGTPTLQFDGQIDTTTLEVGQQRSLTVEVVSLAEKLFERNRGNSLSGSWHKSIWPGELGHDNGTGLALPVAWGAESPPRASAAAVTASGAADFGGYGNRMAAY